MDELKSLIEAHRQKAFSVGCSVHDIDAFCDAALSLIPVSTIVETPESPKKKKAQDVDA